MSKGLGHVQRTILAMIEADPHGAWTVEEICRRVYPDASDVEKKHRVAAIRALQRMKLPGTWVLNCLDRQGREYCIFDSCDDERRIRFAYANRPPFQIDWRETSFDKTSNCPGASL
jgi:hypothetical protein